MCLIVCGVLSPVAADPVSCAGINNNNKNKWEICGLCVKLPPPLHREHVIIAPTTDSSGMWTAAFQPLTCKFKKKLWLPVTVCLCVTCHKLPHSTWLPHFSFVGLLQFVWDCDSLWDCCSLYGTDSLCGTAAVWDWQFVWDCDSLCGTVTVCVGQLQFVWDCDSLCGTAADCMGLWQFVWDCNSLCATPTVCLCWTATVCVQHLQFACVGLLQFVCNTYSLPVLDCCSLCATPTVCLYWTATVCVQHLQFACMGLLQFVMWFTKKVVQSQVCISTRMTFDAKWCSFLLYPLPNVHVPPPFLILFILLHCFRWSSAWDGDSSIPNVDFFGTNFC